MDSSYFNHEYFTTNNKSGYDESSFFLINDVFKKQAKVLYDVLDLRCSRVLDIGCARGNLVYWLRKLGVDAEGIDISEWCKEYSHIREYHMCSNIKDIIHREDETYNTIVSFETLEHIDNIDSVLVNVRRVLARNGIFFATIGSSGHENDISGVSLFSRDTWEGILAKYFTVNRKLQSKIEEMELVKLYKWNIYCLRNNK